MNAKIKRKYNACYRLRKKKVRISSKAKTIYGKADVINVSEVKILTNEYHYVLQTELFSHNEEQ